MPDITLCANQDCPLAPRCRRSEQSGTRPSPHWQAWQVFHGGGDCGWFLPVEGALPGHAS